MRERGRKMSQIDEKLYSAQIGAYWIPNRISAKKSIPNHIIIKLLKAIDKEKPWN